jgi:hypothetical protein
MAVHGTRRRESVSWDYAGLLQLLGNLAVERTRLPLLRCYWYEATVEGRRSADHDTLADLPGVKLRVAKMRPGRREGVEGEIHRDLTTLARNKAVSDVMLVSAEEDLAPVIADVQDMGMRVTLLYISDDDGREISRALRQECDDIVEISAAQLRPFVELISGAEPPRPDEADVVQAGQRPAMNGIGVNGNGNGINGNGNGNGRGPAARSAPYPPPAVRPTVSPVPQPEAPAEPGQQERAEAPGPDYAPAAEFAASTDYGPPAEYNAAAEHKNAVDYGSALEYGPVPDYAAPLPAPVPAPVPAPPREDIYAAPVALPGPAEDQPDRMPGIPRNDLAAYNAGAAREPYQRESMLREPGGGDVGDRLQPVPVALPATGSAQIRRLPARGPGPGGPGPGQPPLGLPSAAPDAGIGPQLGGPQLGGPQLGGPQLGGPQPSGQPTGSQPAVPVAPVVPMDPNAMGYAGGRGGAPGVTRHAIQGPNPNSGPQPVGGPQVPAPVPPAQQLPPTPPMPGGQVPGGPPVPVNQQVPGGPPEIGGQSGPIGLVGPGGYPGAAPAPAPAPAAAPGVSLADAVQSAHEEGQAFGESVARDAPALWLEAVLARKPRMPSDLEARLLQGSALPIDFLLHDEVRHALRRGFWDALERARR